MTANDARNLMKSLDAMIAYIDKGIAAMAETNCTYAAFNVPINLRADIEKHYLDNGFSIAGISSDPSFFKVTW